MILMPRSLPSPRASMAPGLYPQARMTSSIPARARDLTRYHMHGLSATGRMGLGRFSVRGSNLVPFPPTMTMACLTFIGGLTPF